MSEREEVRLKDMLNVDTATKVYNLQGQLLTLEWISTLIESKMEEIEGEKNGG